MLVHQSIKVGVEALCHHCRDITTVGAKVGSQFAGSVILITIFLVIYYYLHYPVVELILTFVA